MNNWKIKSIQRWENKGGALLPRDCNVHFWNYPSIGFRNRDGKQPSRHSLPPQVHDRSLIANGNQRLRVNRISLRKPLRE